METDLLNGRQDLDNTHDASMLLHSRADSASIKGLPLMPRHQSLENLPRAVKDMPTVAGSSVNYLETQLEEMELSRTHESLVTAELEESKQHWQQLRKAYRKSRIQYENMVDPFGVQPDAMSTTQTIAELRERFINDRSLLESYAADVRRIQRKLQAAQSFRSRCELVFMQSARQWTRAPVSNAPTKPAVPLDDTRTLPRTIVSSFISPPEVDFLLERYHSKLAAVSSLGERLADHNYEYWNEVARRELLRDHEETLSVGDDDFEETSEREKNDVLQELSQAMEEADRLKADCISAGSKVQDLEPVGSTFTYSHNLTDIGYGDSLQAALARVPAEAFKDVENVRGDLSENESAHSEPGTASQRVSSWVDDLSLDQDADSWKAASIS
jgi:hypothetical protein